MNRTTYEGVVQLLCEQTEHRRIDLEMMTAKELLEEAEGRGFEAEACVQEFRAEVEADNGGDEGKPPWWSVDR